ncbi:hypothetical protein [Streptomyces microflavus]|uniref:phage tail tube protein n=1 Tax=Streptomyces microflavus TaxID=1919 RepID=UPI003B215476
MDSTFVSKIPGDDSAADSSLTFYEDDVTDDIETDLAKGTTGFILIARKGKAAAPRAWTCTRSVSLRPRPRSPPTTKPRRS